MNRETLEKNKHGKEISEKGQFQKGKTQNQIIVNRTNLKKDTSEKDNSEKGQLWKGII